MADLVEEAEGFGLFGFGDEKGRGHNDFRILGESKWGEICGLIHGIFLCICLLDVSKERWFHANDILAGEEYAGGEESQIVVPE